MKSIIITPKNIQEFKFLSGLLNKLDISSRTLTDEEIEDLGMAILMKQTDRSRKVPRESVMKKLVSK